GNGISAHIYDQAQPEKYARRQVANAEKEQAADPDAEIARLARLAVMQYEQARKGAAEQLGIRTAILDRLVQAERHQPRLAADGKQGHALALPAPESWPVPVNGAELLDDITAAIQRYVVMSEHAARGCALWCVHTYLLDCFLISPRLAIRSPVPRCGKTT